MWIKLWFFLSFVFFSQDHLLHISTKKSPSISLVTENSIGSKSFAIFFPRISANWFHFRKIHGQNREFCSWNHALMVVFIDKFHIDGKLYCAHKETHNACLTGYIWNISFIVNKNHALTKVVLCESCEMYWAGLVRCIKRDWSTELIDSYKESSSKPAIFHLT